LALIANLSLKDQIKSFFLVPILSSSFLPFMVRYLLSFLFFTAGHKETPYYKLLQITLISP
jgi:hypothetical protein